MSKHFPDIIFVNSHIQNQGYSEQFKSPVAAFFSSYQFPGYFDLIYLTWYRYWLYHHLDNIKQNIGNILKVHKRHLFNFKYLVVSKEVNRIYYCNESYFIHTFFIDFLQNLKFLFFTILKNQYDTDKSV